MLARRGCCSGGGLLLEQVLGSNGLVVSKLERCASNAGASTSGPATSHIHQPAASARRQISTHGAADLGSGLTNSFRCSQGLATCCHSVSPKSTAPATLRGFAAAAAALATAAAEPAQSPAPASLAAAASDNPKQVPWPWVDPSRPTFLPKDVTPRKRTPLPLNVALPQLLERLRPGQRASHSLEVFVRFALDPRRSDHLVRGSVVLPYGTGKKIRLVVFAKGAEAEAARQEGVDLIGDEELINAIVSSDGAAINFDKLIATPDFMRPLAKAGKVLGPKGLMPNPKMGTLTNDVAVAIRDIRRGRLDYRLGRDAAIRAALGRASMPASHLEAHVGGLVASLMENKPKSISAAAAAAAAGGRTAAGGAMVAAGAGMTAAAGAGAEAGSVVTASMMDGYIRTFLLKTTHSGPLEISFDSLAEAVKQYRSLVGAGEAAEGNTAGEAAGGRAKAKATAAPPGTAAAA